MSEFTKKEVMENKGKIKQKMTMKVCSLKD